MHHKFSSSALKLLTAYDNISTQVFLNIDVEFHTHYSLGPIVIHFSVRL